MVFQDETNAVRQAQILVCVDLVVDVAPAASPTFIHPSITKIKSAEGGMVMETWAQQFCKSSSYEKWHKHLGHTSNKDIQDTIKHVIGLEDLLQSTHENMRSVRFD